MLFAYSLYVSHVFFIVCFFCLLISLSWGWSAPRRAARNGTKETFKTVKRQNGMTVNGRLTTIMWCDGFGQFSDQVIVCWNTFTQKQSPDGKDDWQQSHHMIVLTFPSKTVTRQDGTTAKRQDGKTRNSQRQRNSRRHISMSPSLYIYLSLSLSLYIYIYVCPYLCINETVGDTKQM